MAWIEDVRGKHRVVWDPPKTSGLRRQSLTLATRPLAVKAQKYVNKHNNAVNVTDVYEALTGEPMPVAAPGGPTFREYAEGWLESRLKSGKITLGTRNTYHRQLEVAFCPEFGDKRLPEIRARDIEKALIGLRAQGLKHQSITRYYSCVFAILNTAVRTEEIPITVNPAMYVDHSRTKVEREPGREVDDDNWLTPEEFKLILSKARQDARPLIQFLGETGARWGEATALQVWDFDPASRVVKIRRAWKSDQKTGRCELGPPKGVDSRMLVVSQELADVLISLTRGQPPEALVFRNTKGKQIHLSDFSSRMWKTAVLAASWCQKHPPTGYRAISTCDCAGVLHKKVRGVHVLRHSYTTWMIANGRTRDDVADDLGHADLQMINKVYRHVMRKKDSRRADLMDEILGRSQAA